MLRDTRSAVAAVVVELLVLLRLVGGELLLLLEEVLREQRDRDVRMCARLVLYERSRLLRLVGPQVVLAPRALGRVLVLVLVGAVVAAAAAVIVVALAASGAGREEHRADGAPEVSCARAGLAEAADGRERDQHRERERRRERQPQSQPPADRRRIQARAHSTHEVLGRLRQDGPELRFQVELLGSAPPEPHLMPFSRTASTPPIAVARQTLTARPRPLAPARAPRAGAPGRDAARPRRCSSARRGARRSAGP